jgi:hypothetical protein
MALLLASLLAAGRLDASVETLGQLGSGADSTYGPGAGTGVDLAPSLSGVFQEHDLSLAALYAPRFLLRDGGSGARQSAQATGTLAQTRTLQLNTSEKFLYGRNDFSWDPGAARPFDLLEPIAPVISDNLFTDSEAGFTWLPARGSALNVSAGYAAYGGLSAASQQLLPLQQGPQLYAGFDHELTRVDQLSTELYAAHTFASSGGQTSQVKLSQGWQRQFDASTRGRVTAGASVYRRAPEAASLGLSPVAGVELEHDLLETGQRLELKAAAGYAPHQSPLAADLLQRAELSAEARWVLSGSFALRARAAGAREFGALGSKFLLGALDASYPLNSQLSVSLGTETVLQQVPGPSGSAVRWLAFTALDYRARGLL